MVVTVIGTIGLLILALVILAFFLLIGIRQNQKDRALKRSLGQGLGLRPVTQITQELTRQITSVHPHGQNHVLELRNVFSKALPQGELYLFDLWESRSGYRGYAQECAFGVTSSAANLPRMSLFPRSDVPGKPAGPLSPILTWALSPSEPEIRLGQPGFEARYLLTGGPDSAVRAALKPALIDYLVKTPPLLLRAREHTFTVSARNLKNGRKAPDQETVKALYDQAIRISSLLFG